MLLTEGDTQTARQTEKDRQKHIETDRGRQCRVIEAEIQCRERETETYRERDKRSEAFDFSQWIDDGALIILATTLELMVPSASIIALIDICPSSQRWFSTDAICLRTPGQGFI